MDNLLSRYFIAHVLFAFGSSLPTLLSSLTFLIQSALNTQDTRRPKRGFSEKGTMLPPVLLHSQGANYVTHETGVSLMFLFSVIKLGSLLLSCKLHFSFIDHIVGSFVPKDR